MSTIAKVFVALMAATAVVAAPNKRQTFNPVTCTFLMVPDAFVDTTDPTLNIDAEFNYVIGRTLAQQVSGTTIEGSNISIDENPDNSFTVVRSNAVDGKTASQVETILTGLIGVTNNGFFNNAQFNWYFDDVTC